MKTLDEYIEYLDGTIKMHDDLCDEITSDAVKNGLKQQIGDNIRLREWLTDYRKLKEQEARMIDGHALMLSLSDWWCSSFGEEETDEATAIRKVMEKVEESLDQFRMKGVEP